MEINSGESVKIYLKFINFVFQFSSFEEFCLGQLNK